MRYNLVCDRHFENTCATSVEAHIYLDVSASEPHPAFKLVVSQCDPG